MTGADQPCGGVGALAGRQDGANALPSAVGGLTVYGHDFTGVVEHDGVAIELVGHLVAAQDAHLGALDKGDDIGLVVKRDLFGLAFGELVHALAFLPEKHPLVGGGPQPGHLTAFGVLLHIHAGSAQNQRTLGRHHLAGELGQLTCFVVAHAVGFDLHGLIAVGFFSLAGQGQQAGAQGQKAPTAQAK
jgi:hypothetical protein